MRVGHDGVTVTQIPGDGPASLSMADYVKPSIGVWAVFEVDDESFYPVAAYTDRVEAERVAEQRRQESEGRMDVLVEWVKVRVEGE